MLIRPTSEELENFGEPDFIIYNAGQFPANRFTTGMTSTTSVSINFKRNEMIILGVSAGNICFDASTTELTLLFLLALFRPSTPVK
jgi:ATP-dependent phosphoenolpyruvate carboxykinase